MDIKKSWPFNYKKIPKETLEGNFGPNPSPYKITTVYNLYINPSPPLINFEKKSSRKFMVPSLLHMFVACCQYERTIWPP
jgi:hypothetical protein